MDLLQYIGSIGGIAGVLAVLILYLCRHLINQMREDRKFMEDRITHILEDYNKVVSDSTRAQTELITWLKAKNGHA